MNIISNLYNVSSCCKHAKIKWMCKYNRWNAKSLSENRSWRNCLRYPDYSKIPTIYMLSVSILAVVQALATTTHSFTIIIRKNGENSMI